MFCVSIATVFRNIGRKYCAYFPACRLPIHQIKYDKQDQPIFLEIFPLLFVLLRDLLLWTDGRSNSWGLCAFLCLSGTFSRKLVKLQNKKNVNAIYFFFN
jgi:hypothetical protein